VEIGEEYAIGPMHHWLRGMDDPTKGLVEVIFPNSRVAELLFISPLSLNLRKILSLHTYESPSCEVLF